MGRYFIKALGRTDAPYSQARHEAEDHRIVGFPGKSARIAVGDTLFLYAVGHGKFFGIATLEDWLPDPGPNPRYPLQARVFVNVMLRNVENGPNNDEVFPLPDGTDTLSMRQHSHIAISQESAKKLASLVLKAATHELIR